MPRTARRSATEPYHHGDLRRALVGAALEIVAREGRGALSLRGAARRAGVSHAAPAHHFRDLAGLIEAVAVEGFERLRAALEAAASGARDPLDALRALARCQVGFAGEQPGLYRTMFDPRLAREPARPRLAAASDAAFAVWVEAVEDGQVEGALRAGDASELALAAWAGVHGLSALWCHGRLAAHQALGAEELARRWTATLLHGLRA